MLISIPSRKEPIRERAQALFAKSGDYVQLEGDHLLRRLHPMTFWFYIAITVVAGLIVYKGWRGSYLKEACITAGLLALLAWITGPVATDHQRCWIAGATVLAGVVLIRLQWKSFWWPPIIVVGTALSLIFVFLTSSVVNTLFFEEFMPRIFGFFVASFLGWVLVRVAFPRMTAKYQAGWVQVLSIMFTIPMLITALAWWLQATEINVYPQNPVIRTGDELRAEYERSAGLLDYRGMFLVGRVGDLKEAAEVELEKSNNEGVLQRADDFIAYYDGGRSFSISSSSQQSYLPIFYKVTLESGEEINVKGIDTVRQTFNWPEGGPNLWMHALRHGDPVVVWGQPGKAVSLTDGGKVSWTVDISRVIAYGTPEEFIEGFLKPGVKTARLFGWGGFGCIFLSFLPLAYGIFHARRLKKQGSDEPPPPGWESPRDAMKKLVGLR